MDYIKAIEERRAVRTYDASRPLTESEISTIRKAIDEAQSPFGGDIAVRLHKFELSGK